MTTYLKNLAEMLVNLDSGVQPRLLGRFEPPHPIGMGLFDVEPADDREPAPSHDASRAEEPALAEPPHPSGEQPSPAEPVPITSPPEIVSEPPTSQWQLHRTEAPRPEVEPVAPLLSREVSPIIQPTLEASAPETVKRSAPPATVEPVQPVPKPDLSEGPTDTVKLGPVEEHQPGPVRPKEEQPARPQPHAATPVIPVEVRLTSAREPAAPSPPASSESAPFAERSTPPLTVSKELRPQIEPAAPPAKTGPVPSPAMPVTIGEPILVRDDGVPFMEPLFTEPMAPLPFHHEKADQKPNIRVTIGRIEVRAALPPAPAPRAQPMRRRPALPLDQYLKRRSEGKG